MNVSGRVEKEPRYSRLEARALARSGTSRSAALTCAQEDERLVFDITWRRHVAFNGCWFRLAAARRASGQW